jgi:hypothetical protein
MKYSLLALLLALAFTVAPPAFADACQGDEVYYFGCHILGADHQISENAIGLCGAQGEGHNGWATWRYVYETAKGVELSYPPDPAEGWKRLFFSHWFKKGLYHARVRFENAGYSYQIYFDDNPPSTTPDEIAGPDAGVRVYKKGKLVADIVCGERPGSYFDEIRQGISCDMQSPFGAKGCAENAPEVK